MFNISFISLYLCVKRFLPGFGQLLKFEELDAWFERIGKLSEPLLRSFLASVRVLWMALVNFNVDKQGEKSDNIARSPLRHDAVGRTEFRLGQSQG